MTDNMKLWNSVCKTDPKFTKEPDFGRKFTTIDAAYQVQRATETWGPIGEGWRFDWSLDFESMPGVVLATVELTIGKGSKESTVAAMGGATTSINTKKGPKIDTDAPKKAITDGLTKAFFYTGMCADVFLNKHQDSKYLQEIQKEFAGFDRKTARREIGRLCKELFGKDEAQREFELYIQDNNYTLNSGSGGASAKLTDDELKAVVKDLGDKVAAKGAK